MQEPLILFPLFLNFLGQKSCWVVSYHVNNLNRRLRKCQAFTNENILQRKTSYTGYYPVSIVTKLDFYYVTSLILNVTRSTHDKPVTLHISYRSISLKYSTWP